MGDFVTSIDMELRLVEVRRDLESHIDTHVIFTTKCMESTDLQNGDLDLRVSNGSRVLGSSRRTVPIV